MAKEILNKEQYKKLVILKKDHVKTFNIEDNAITSSKINDGAITNAKILNKSISTDKLIDEVITSNKLNKKELKFDAKLIFNNITKVNNVIELNDKIILKNKELIKNLNAEYVHGLIPEAGSKGSTIVQRTMDAKIIASQFVSDDFVGAPFIINSSKRVDMLNAEYLNDLSTGNKQNNIPISNGMLNQNLNAELLNGIKLSKNKEIKNEDVIPLESSIYKTLNDKLIELNKNIDNLISSIKDNIKPNKLLCNSKNTINDLGHTHELDSKLVNDYSDQFIDGNKIFKDIKSSQEIIDETHLINKKYFNENTIINKNIIGLNIEYQDSRNIIVHIGECLDSTYKKKLVLSKKIKVGLKNFIPYITYHIFLTENNEVFLDTSLTFSNKIYRRIGSIITDKNGIVKFDYDNNLKQYTIDLTCCEYFLDDSFIKLNVPTGIKVIALFNTKNDYINNVTNNKGEIYFCKGTEDSIIVKNYGWIDYSL